MERIINPNLDTARILLTDVGFKVTWYVPAIVVAGKEWEPEGDPLELIMLFDGTLINNEGHVMDDVRVTKEKRCVPELLVPEGTSYTDSEGTEWGVLYTAQNYDEALERGWFPLFPVILKDFTGLGVLTCKGKAVEIPYTTLHMGGELRHLAFCPNKYQKEE